MNDLASGVLRKAVLQKSNKSDGDNFRGPCLGFDVSKGSNLQRFVFQHN